MIELKDVIHFYLGAQCVNTWFLEDHEMYNNEWRFTGIELNKINPYKLECTSSITWTDSIKPILRRLEDMTIDEQVEMGSLKGKTVTPYIVVNYHTPISFDWMIKHGFDIFGLIETDQAIDAKTIINNKVELNPYDDEPGV